MAPHVKRYGADSDAVPRSKSAGLLAGARRRSAYLLGRSSLAGHLLLADLRTLYLAAQANELAWMVLVQSAQAVRDRELLDAAVENHEQATMCAKWVRTRIKETAPQLYATG
jgi:hypothetical protein